ncbi:MAG: hypothetical protein CR990_00600 [Desulfococcus sp.]|nr:MAG: hypothetical protein CR990_00600 [Desulfococcus sp.]
MAGRSIASLIRENKTAFIIIAVVLFLIEMEILAMAVLKSRREKNLQILDGRGNIIYEADGDNLSDFNKYYFEKTFGSLDQYDKRLEIRERPFPFRAWLTAAAGVPIGIILLFAFVVKAYVALFYGDPGGNGPKKGARRQDYETEMERIIATISSFNIFTIGFLVLTGVFMYWVLPNMVAYLGRVSIETLIRFKWVVLGMTAVLLGLLTWIIYLRYLLAKRNIDRQADVEKARLELAWRQGEMPVTPLLTDGAASGNNGPDGSAPQRDGAVNETAIPPDHPDADAGATVTAEWTEEEPSAVEPGVVRAAFTETGGV